MEEAATADPQVYSNGTDTMDVADHDDIFDMNASAEVTQTDDEFENNERLMEEEDAVTKKEFVEVEDIFQNDNSIIHTNDTEHEKMDKEKEEVEDIFGDDLHVQEEEEHDYEPIFTADAREEEPVIKITDVDTERTEPEVVLEPEGNLDNAADTSKLDADLPFPDMPRKSDISLNWEDVVEEEQKRDQSSAPTLPSTDTEAPAAPVAEQEEEIDEGEVAKFVEKILISSMNEVSSQAEEEGESQNESCVEVQISEPALETPETTVESDNVLSLETGPEKVDVDVVDEPAEKEDFSVSIKTPASVHPEINGLAKDEAKNDKEVEIQTAVPLCAVEVAKEVEDEVKDSPVKDSPVKDIKETPSASSNFVDSPDVGVSRTFDKTEELTKTPDSLVIEESKPEVEVTKSMESSEGRQRKMSVPKPRDLRKDLSGARPSFFGSGTSGPKPFLSNTLPRVSVLPKISTSYQRKSPTSPLSLSGNYSSFDSAAEALPTVAGPDLTKDDTKVIKELDTIELPLIETLSKPTSSNAATVSTDNVDPIVPTKETKVESGPMAPVYAHKGAGKDPIILDGTSPEELEAIFAKDPEEDKTKKSMGKDDVIASTRVRKVSRTTWKGQDEFQKSIDKSAVILDEPQAASLKRYEERKKQRIDAFSGKVRAREDSTSEAESEGSQSSHSGPKMPDVVQSGGKVSSNGNPETEKVAPKLNMKSVRSLWEQKAAEVEQRRRSLQTKSRPVSQGERSRPSQSKSINKSCDALDNLDDSIEGSTTYSYDGTSDDGSTKRESLIERDLRLHKERTLDISKDRDRLRSESTSSRDESQQSETSESLDDQAVDIVRDTELRRDSDDGRSSPSQSSGYMSGRSTPSTPAGDDILKVKTGKSSGKTPELKMSLSPTDPEASSNYKEYQKALRGSKADGKFSKSATFPRRMENYDKEGDSSGVSPTNSVGDVPDVIMVDGNKATSPTEGKPRKTSIVQQGIKLSQTLEKKKIEKLEKKPRRSLMELEIAAQREKEEAFRREQQTRKMSTSKSLCEEAPPKSPPASSSAASSVQTSPRKTSVSGVTAKQVYKDLNYAPQTNKKKLALAGHWEHKWK
ncbi:uncharacterized protein LOC121424450 [Lytechinus variegatus]|uniref:uncharacterized protein LOC121424450 n=1 Tax=Lytechinus variegatus TaxID=7654 RepID=UPI001BB2AD8F|nr:uncharacterized protein LOC121424450 [Lytechinus variegatus]